MITRGDFQETKLTYALNNELKRQNIEIYVKVKKRKGNKNIYKYIKKREREY